MKPVTNEIKEVAPKTKTKGLKVERAYLHQAVSWNTVINSEKTLDGTPTVHGGNKVKNLIEMALVPQGLAVKVKVEGVERTGIVPYANVALAILEEGQEV
jgi:hypothetical protein